MLTLLLSSATAAGSARAQSRAARTCNGPVIRGSAELEQAWGASIAQLRDHAASIRDVDRCAEVNLVPEGDHVLVVIRLADGRSAVRPAATPLAAIATAEALLTVLPDNDVRPAEPVATAAPVTAAAPTDESLAPPVVPTVVAPAPRSFSFDAGIGVSTRITVNPMFVGYGLTAYADVDVNDWLVGSWLRWDFQDLPITVDVPPHFTASSFLLGIFAGRRFALGKAALDVVGGPNLVVDTEEAGSGLEANESGGDLGGLSLGTSVRLIIPRAGRPGFFALAGGELYPRRLTHDVRADASLPVLPAWSFTLALGMSWRAL